MRKVLLLTVGTGTRPDVDIVKPLMKTVNDSSPTLTVFLVSEVSRPYALRIIEQLRLSQEECEVVQLPDPDSLESVYGNINCVMRSLIQRGFTPNEITIDFTSGTKTMTSGAILSGVAFECSGLKYITGKRKNGVVQDGTEKFITEPPNKILAHKSIDLGKKMIEAFRFDAAIEIFESINRALLEESEVKILEGLTYIAKAYDSWDRFMQNRVDGYVSKVSDDLKECDPFRISKDIRQRLVAVFKALERGEISEDLLADLFNNAKRRFVEGKFDDATSRLYRLVEMVAQTVLWKRFGIKTGDVLEEKIPVEILLNLKLKKDPVDGQIRIGLQKSFDLLKELKDPIGQRFHENRRLSALLKQRNESFLAHGTKPISREACEGLFEETKALMKLYIPSIDDLCQQLEFPWQKSRG